MSGLSFSDAGFVIERVVKGERERADRPVHLLLREPEHGARVDAAVRGANYQDAQGHSVTRAALNCASTALTTWP